MIVKFLILQSPALVILPGCDNGWTQATRASRDTLGSTDTDRFNLVLNFLMIL